MKTIKLKDDAPVVAVDIVYEGNRRSVTRTPVEVPDDEAEFALGHYKLGEVFEAVEEALAETEDGAEENDSQEEVG